MTRRTHQNLCPYMVVQNTWVLQVYGKKFASSCLLMRAWCKAETNVQMSRTLAHGDKIMWIVIGRKNCHKGGQI